MAEVQEAKWKHTRLPESWPQDCTLSLLSHFIVQESQRAEPKVEADGHPTIKWQRDREG